MADLQDTVCSSSSPPPESDDISLFLHQVLLRSSSFSSPSHSMPFLVSPLPHDTYRPTLPAESSSAAWPAAGNVFSTSGAYFPPPATVLSSSSVGNTDNDLDDQPDCESEDGYEAMVEEPQPRLRNYSKRSRAAEIHNLSEKRRRSRINEKMKALQKLIPNSNKTDKASMLDEAIEYLKQLQLQVQMLTVRNGLSLYPPDLQPPPASSSGGGLQSNNQTSHFRRAFGQENGQPSFHVHQGEHGLNSQTSLGMQPMVQNHLAPYQHHHQYQTEDNSWASFGKQRNMMIHVADQRSDFQMGTNFKDGLESAVPLSENSIFFDSPFEWPEYRKRSYRG